MKRSFTVLCVSLFIAALLIRLACVLMFPQEAPDSIRYIRIARSIIEHGTFSLGGTQPTDFRAPGYPAFIACIYSFAGESPTAVRVVQAVLDSFTCLFVFAAVYLIWQRRFVASLMCVLAIFHPALCAGTAFILSETLTTFMITLSVLLLIAGFRFKAPFWFAAGGLCMGLATLTRPITLPFPALLTLFSIPFYRNRRWLVKAMGICTVSFALVLLPWIIRNYNAFHRFIPVSSNLGGNLYIGSNEAWDGDYNPDIMAIRQKIEAELKHDGPGHYPVDDYLKQKALERIKENPLGYLKLCVKKLYRFWFHIPGSKELLENRPYLKGALYFFYCMLLALFITSCITAWRKDELILLSNVLILTLMFLFSALHGALVALPRYRIPLEPAILIFSAHAVLFFWEKYTSKAS